MIRSLNIVAFVAVLLALMSACTITPDTYTIATVNDHRITLKDIQENPNFRRVVDETIMKILFTDAAAEKGITVSEEQVDEEIERMREGLGGEKAMQEYLKAEGRTMQDMREYFEFTQLIMALLESKVEATDEKVRAEFEMNPDFYRRQYAREHNLTVDEAENLTFEDMKDYLIEQYKRNMSGQLFEPTLNELKAKANIEYVYLPPEQRARIKAEEEQMAELEASEKAESVPDEAIQEDGSGEEPAPEAEEAAEEAEADAEETGADEETPEEGDESATANGAVETESEGDETDAEDGSGQEQSGS